MTVTGSGAASSLISSIRPRPARRRAVEDVIAHLLHARPKVFDPPRREGFRENRADVRVLRRVEKEHRDRLERRAKRVGDRHIELLARLRRQADAGEGILLEARVAQHGEGVVVAREDPHRRERITPHRLGLAQFAIERVRVGDELRMADAFADVDIPREDRVMCEPLDGAEDRPHRARAYGAALDAVPSPRHALRVPRLQSRRGPFVRETPPREQGGGVGAVGLRQREGDVLGADVAMLPRIGLRLRGLEQTKRGLRQRGARCRTVWPRGLVSSSSFSTSAGETPACSSMNAAALSVSRDGEEQMLRRRLVRAQPAGFFQCAGDGASHPRGKTLPHRR